MTTHYLVDMFGSPMSTSPIIDVRAPANGQTLTNGTFVVRVPDGVDVDKPTNLSDLITKKYSGLLAYYAGFSFISFDDMLDTSGIDFSTSGPGVFGQRGSVGLYAGTFNFPTIIGLKSVSVPLSSTPSQAIVVWETFQYTDSDDKNDRTQRTYVEADPALLTCRLSFNNLSTGYGNTTSGAVFNIPVPDQGNTLILNFLNLTTTPKVFLGSWAVIY